MLYEACNCLSISKCCVGSPADSLVKGSHCSTDLRQEKVLNRKRNCFRDPKHPGRDKGRVGESISGRLALQVSAV